MLSDAARCEHAKDKYCDSQSAEYKFGHGFEPAPNGFHASLLHLLSHELFAVHPVEHDAGKTCAKRADIDGDKVHPPLDDALNADRNNGADCRNDQNGARTGKPELFLNGCGGRFIEVNQRGHAREEYADKEYNDNQAAARHGLEQRGQENEHQSGTAAVELAARGCHGRDDDKRCQHGGKRVKQRDLPCRADDVLVVAQVGAVNQCAVAREGQREKRLTERVYPSLLLADGFRVDAEHVAVPLGCARLEEHIHRKPQKQQEKQRHHDFIGFFDARSNAERHDDKGDDKA